MNVGIVGATGAVGLELVDVLSKRQFPINKLRFFASQRSAGKTLDTPFGKITVELFSPELARETDVLFLAASGNFSKQYATELSALNGPLVIDNSSAFRLDPDVIQITYFLGKCLLLPVWKPVLLTFRSKPVPGVENCTNETTWTPQSERGRTKLHKYGNLFPNGENKDIFEI